MRNKTQQQRMVIGDFIIFFKVSVNYLNSSLTLVLVKISEGLRLIYEYQFYFF